MSKTLKDYEINFRNLKKKCFGVCGCSSTTNGQCKNCDSSHFLGYDTTIYSDFSLLTRAPDTNEANCSTKTEFIDVSLIYPRSDFSDISN